MISIPYMIERYWLYIVLNAPPSWFTKALYRKRTKSAPTSTWSEVRRELRRVRRWRVRRPKRRAPLPCCAALSLSSWASWPGTSQVHSSRLSLKPLQEILFFLLFASRPRGSDFASSRTASSAPELCSKKVVLSNETEWMTHAIKRELKIFFPSLWIKTPEIFLNYNITNCSQKTPKL